MRCFIKLGNIYRTLLHFRAWVKMIRKQNQSISPKKHDQLSTLSGTPQVKSVKSKNIGSTSAICRTKLNLRVLKNDLIARRFPYRGR